MQYIENENTLLQSRNLAETFSNFDMSSYNKEHMDPNKQNCKYIVLFKVTLWTTSFSALKCCLIQESELCIIIQVPDIKQKKVYTLKDSINQELLNVFNVSVSICWEDTTQLILKVCFKTQPWQAFWTPSGSRKVHLIHHMYLGHNPSATLTDPDLKICNEKKW